MDKMFTVILADDDQDEHDFFKEAIEALPERENIRLLCFPDGEKLIRWIKKVEVVPDVLFLDINMPYLNGFETLQLIKKMELHKCTPVIIYSTSSNPADMKKAYEMGADLYLTKTLPVSILPEKLKKIIDCIKTDVPLQQKDFSPTAF